MARKRKSKRIDEFLRSRQQGQEVVLRESIRQANLLFRIVVTVLLVALLLLLLNQHLGDLIRLLLKTALHL